MNSGVLGEILRTPVDIFINLHLPYKYNGNNRIYGCILVFTN